MPGGNNYLSYLFKNDDSKSKYQILVFTIYVVLLAVAASKHEPWMDEAQAWLLARDANLSDIFIKYLRYEGSPGLWHLILIIPAKLGLPYFTINILSAAFAASGIWIFLRYSPFPPVIKILFPFSYFVLFQYAVVARSYCLILPVLFLIAIKYRTKIQQPIIFSLLLCLLANISTHTFLMAGGIFAVHLLDVAKEWKRLDKSTKANQIAAALLLALTAVFIVLILAPPSDHLLGGGNNLSLTNFFNVSKWAISGALAMDESSRFRLAQIWLSLAVFLITVLWLHEKKLALLFLLPLLFILGLFAVKYRNLWHDGVTFLLWIFVLWVSLDKNESESYQRTSILRRVVILLATIVLATQVYWSFYAIRNDLYNSYSGSYEVAGYIKENHLEDARIFASGWKSIAIQPYFDKNIFYNHNDGSQLRFWDWTISNQTPMGLNDQITESLYQDQPDIIILASDHINVNSIPELQGYRLENVFHGRLYWKTGFHELNSYWLFHKKD